MPNSLAICLSDITCLLLALYLLFIASSSHCPTVFLADTEGEFCSLDQPATDKDVLAALAKYGLEPRGIVDSVVLHLAGTEPSNPNHPDLREFSAHLEDIPPHILVEIIGMEAAQEERFWEAHDLAKRVLRATKIFLQSARDEQIIAILDDSTDGYPNLDLAKLYDMVLTIVMKLEKRPIGNLISPAFQSEGTISIISDQVHAFQNSPQKASWLKLLGQLRMLMRTGVFDVPNVDRVDWGELMVAGRVIVLDLSDTSNRTVANLVIAHVLQNIQRVQEARYNYARKNGSPLVPVEIYIEEAHEFLSGAKARRMELVMAQMRELILRGRKRKLGVCLISQYPQHLPREMLDAMNSAVIHKITGEETIRGLKHSAPTVTDAQWRAVGMLPQGSALVAFPGQLKMPVIVACIHAHSRS